jgi:hypothetical protein
MHVCQASRIFCLTKKRREIAMVHTLVPSDRVEAASVYGRDGDKIGTIELRYSPVDGL